MVVDHPVRRRIILHLIVAGNIGLTSALATLVVTLMQGNKEGGHFWMMIVLLIGAVVGIGLLMNVSMRRFKFE